ncbi:MAG: leucyl/phenylalanyl-tRNA--protein transferase [Rhodoferax sp.]
MESAWDAGTSAPGLLAAGADLEVATLEQAYANAIFPWFSKGQPLLWWSPDPRMVLPVPEFRLHRSLRNTLRHFVKDPACEVRFDHAFSAVIEACATAPRAGQSSTWIVPAMVEAYTRLHQAGLAHSVETWIDGELVGGLYCVSLGRAVFGESMFTRIPNGSKIALAALVAFCREAGISLIDCQQNTRHLASLGAREIPRKVFLTHVRSAESAAMATWSFSRLYWRHILSA